MTEELTENQVIEGVKNYLLQKGKTQKKTVRMTADAAVKQHGVDLAVNLGNNRYFIEAKGTKRSDGTPMRSRFDTNFKWAVAQIVLRIHTDPTKYADIYAIAVPDSVIGKCKRSIENNVALRMLKIRLFGAFIREDGTLFCNEYIPRDIYIKKGRRNTTAPEAGRRD